MIRSKFKIEDGQAVLELQHDSMKDGRRLAMLVYLLRRGAIKLQVGHVDLADGCKSREELDARLAAANLVGVAPLEIYFKAQGGFSIEELLEGRGGSLPAGLPALGG